MQTRASSSLGLGGRPNKLNQFLTLLFIIGVQLAAELQRWRYESANYPSFVNQYFEGSHIFSRRMNPLMPTGANQVHFNPLNSFYDQVTPPIIQASEHYSALVRDYCLIHRTEDLFSRQIYLCLIVILLIFLIVSNRRRARISGASAAASRVRSHPTLKQPASIGGKQLASQHEANLVSASQISASTSQFIGASSGSGVAAAAASLVQGNMFVVSLLSSFVFATSLALQVSGNESIVANGDLVCSLTLVVIAFIALLGIFLPILLGLRRGTGSTSSASSLLLSSNSPLMSSSASSGEQRILAGSVSKTALRRRQKLAGGGPSSGDWPSPTANGAFAIFPEFAPTGLRRPSSAEGNTSISSGAGSRRLFVDTNEARRSMSAALADLGPSEDSLRSMGFYGSNPALDRLEESARHTKEAMVDKNAHPNTRSSHHPYTIRQHHHHNNNHNHQHQHHGKTSAGSKPPPAPPMPAPEQRSATTTKQQQPGRNEKRLIMLDVDPCCPRHGHAVDR